MNQSAGYRIVKLASGAHSVHSLAHGETFHPVVGPVAEAETLYIRQPKLLQRMAAHAEEFVIWDVGLGAAANAITVFQAAREIPRALRLVSFDHTLEPLEFALKHTEYLTYLSGYEPPATELVRAHRVAFKSGSLSVKWEVHLADFPSLLTEPAAAALPKPHAIMFDAFSPAKNPAMWTEPVFAGVFGLLDPERPCLLPTYSRSTMLRVTLLVAGFYVGVGHGTGEKEETTIACNTLDSLEEPLDSRWLTRALRSHSAEPMWQPSYRQAPLTPETRARLQAHPQFCRG